VRQERLKDQKFLHLMARMLKAGVQTPGGIVQDELGSPQGSIVSPVIANVFLDHVAVFSQLRQGILTNFGTLISANFGRVMPSTSAGVNS